MTTASAALIEAVPASRVSPWRGPFVEFMAVGGATLALLPIAWACRAVLGLDTSELGFGFLTFYGAYFVNDPHFSVTYLLFYKDVKRRAFGDALPPKQRLRYVVAGFVVPIALATWAAYSLVHESPRSLGLLMDVMFLLVGWHYVKQGFGVLAVLSARRGTRYSSVERTVFLSHCFAGWAYAWANPSAPSKEVEEKGLVYFSLARPEGLETVTHIAFVASSLALLFVLARKWRRERRLPPLAPLVGFLITVWVWTVYSSIDPLIAYVIPALHSVQYLYFVWLLKKNEAKVEEGPPSFGRPASVRLGGLAVSALALGWVLFHGAPDVLDGVHAARVKAAHGPLSALGPTPFFAALFAFVNIHHYFMDYVIWRREQPETRFLL